MGADSIFSSVAGPVLSSALNDNGSSAAGAQVAGNNNAVNASSALTGQALQTLNTTYATAKSDAQNAFNTANNQITPYNNAGYGANDILMDQLGIARPAAGSAVTVQANQQYQDALGKYNAAQSSLGKIDDLFNQAVAINQFVHPTGNETTADKLRYIQSVRDQEAQRVAQNPIFAGSRNPFIGAVDNSLPALQSAYAASQGPAPKFADFLNGAPAGNITATPQQATQEFFNTPAYQLLFNQGGATMDPNATVLDRFRADPGYQFDFSQGIKARDASAAAKGNLLSGNQLQDLTTFGTGLADQTYNNWANRLGGTYTNYLGQLTGQQSQGANLANSGRNAATSQGGILANIGTGLGNQVAGLLANQGAINANAAIASGNALASSAAQQAKSNNQLAGSLGNSLTKFLQTPSTSNSSTDNGNLPFPNALTNYLPTTSNSSSYLPNFSVV